MYLHLVSLNFAVCGITPNDIIGKYSVGVYIQTDPRPISIVGGFLVVAYEGVVVYIMHTIFDGQTTDSLCGHIVYNKAVCQCARLCTGKTYTPHISTGSVFPYDGIVHRSTIMQLHATGCVVGSGVFLNKRILNDSCNTCTTTVSRLVVANPAINNQRFSAGTYGVVEHTTTDTVAGTIRKGVVLDEAMVNLPISHQSDACTAVVRESGS